MTIQSTNSTTPVTLNARDNYTLTENARLEVTGDDAITALSFDSRAAILGDVIVEDGVGYVVDTPLTGQVRNELNVLGTGSIISVGGFSAVELRDGSQDSVVNFGEIVCVGSQEKVTGIEVGAGHEFADIANFGLVSGTMGMAISGSGAFIRNGGEIAGRMVGVELLETASLVNSGLVSGGIQGVRMEDFGIEINNAGVLEGGVTGLLVTANGSGLVINSGVIYGTLRGINVQAGSVPLRIINKGEISGEIAYGSGDLVNKTETVRNSGAFLGDVLLGGGDDIYRGVGDGYAAGVIDGGGGNDLLRGGGLADELLGDVGNDLLRGGDGDDELQGQGGRDRLNGGRGDDLVRGGAGADIFVLSRVAGDDHLLDFTDGVDRIDLTAFGLRSSQFTGQVTPALSNAGGGATFLDLEILGGVGSVLIEGLAINQADAADFIL